MVIKTWKVKEEVKEEKIKGDNIRSVRNERNEVVWINGMQVIFLKFFTRGQEQLI